MIALYCPGCGVTFVERDVFEHAEGLDVNGDCPNCPSGLFPLIEMTR